MGGVAEAGGSTGVRPGDRRAAPTDERGEPRLLCGFIGGERLWLRLARRLRCRACEKVFTQPLAGMGPRQRASVVAHAAILGALPEQSFAALRRSCGGELLSGTAAGAEAGGTMV